MLFNSWQFLIFFPIVTALYFFLPQKLRAIFLLLASCVFYMVYKIEYLLILFFLILVDYFAGILIERSSSKNKKLFLVLSLAANLGILIFFKYFNFLNLGSIFKMFPFGANFDSLNILLPLGLSFHTFQSMSYTIEVFKGRAKAETNILTYALYVMFYPQLVAGPIERPQHLLPQLKQNFKFEYSRTVSGLRLMLWGLFKKMVIADRLAALVNPVYQDPSHQSALTLLIPTYLFAYQIYCDFSGYCDIAIGAARIMGINLVNNFNYP